MNKKIFFTVLMIFISLIAFCSYSFAATNMMNNARNAVMDAGNAIGDTIVEAKNAVVDGARGLTNGATTLGNDAMNGVKNMGNDAVNGERNIEDNAVDTMNTTGGIFDNNNDNYTATRTATTNNGFLGMSDTTWTWLILGIVGIAIVALVWYYGAQYEHRNYNND